MKYTTGNYRTPFSGIVNIVIVSVNKDETYMAMVFNDEINKFVPKIVDDSFLDTLKVIEFSEEVPAIRFKGSISQDDIKTLRGEFDNLDESEIRDAISSINIGGIYDDLIAEFGISGDTDIKDAIHEAIINKRKS